MSRRLLVDLPQNAFHPLASHRGRMVVAVLIAVTVGLVVGGAFRGFGRGHDNAADAAIHPSAAAGPEAPASTNLPNPLPSTAPLKQGTVVANEAAGDLTTEVALGRTRSLDGAANAFTSYAVWLVGSPAAAEAPDRAAAAVGGIRVNPTDARLVADMQRGSGAAFDAAQGAYRVLGHAGEADLPTEVMVEVTAPLTLDGKTEWRTIGGVVGWTAEGWRLVSIRPQDVPQPAARHDDVRDFTVGERARTLRGLGWHAFRVPAGR